MAHRIDGSQGSRVVAYGEMRGLIEAVGKSNALQILFESEVFGAEESLRMGLVNRVVADEALDAQVMKTPARVAEGAPPVARWHKKFANRLMEPRPLTPEEADESFHCFGTEDFKAGYRAFLETRKPRFSGR